MQTGWNLVTRIKAWQTVLCIACLFIVALLICGCGAILQNGQSETTAITPTPVATVPATVPQNADTVVFETVTPAPTATPELPNEPTGVTVTEWMPKNRSTLLIKGAEGHTLQPDYIELYNGGEEEADLSALYISNDPSNPYLIQLPKTMLAAGEYCIIYCTGQDETVSEGISVPLKLDADNGGTLLLTGCRGTCFFEATYGETEQDCAYMIDNGNVLKSRYPTPGYANTAEACELMQYGGEPVTGLCIYEAMAANRTESRTNRTYYDWVELKNISDTAVNLSGYTLTDKLTDLTRGALPDVTLEPGEILLLYCSGDTTLTGNGVYHLGFCLNGGEESLFLVDAIGQVIDVMRLFDTPYDGSLGRMDGQCGVYRFTDPTPGETNRNGTKRTVRTETPVADMPSGQYTDSVTVTLTGEGSIYYTLDGSIPTEKSKSYTAPITVSNTTVLRAVSIAEGKRVSEPLTLSLLINENQTLPVVSVAMDPEDYDGEEGIFTNPLEEWEKQAHVTMLIDGDTVERDCGIRISGQASRERLHKSFRLVFRGRYGGELKYDLFKDGVSVDTFTEILLRGGTDSKYGVIREAFMASVALNDKSTTMIQSMRPAVLYINGAYYGIQMIAEAYCDEFFADYFHTDKNSVEIVKSTLKEKNGGEELYPLLKYMRSHDLSKTEYYEYVAARLDLDSVIDWTIYQAYYGNDDISGNIRYVRYDGTDGKWRWVLYDVEFGMKSAAGFDLPLSEGQTGDMVSALLKNDTFRDMFLKRLAYHCSVTFDKDRCLAIFTDLGEQVDSEIERDFTRWKCDPAVYRSNYKQIYRLIAEKDRVGQLKKSIQKELKLTDAEMEQYFGAE